jgi:hypothetical protein
VDAERGDPRRSLLEEVCEEAVEESVRSVLVSPRHRSLLLLGRIFDRNERFYISLELANGEMGEEFDESRLHPPLV